MEFIPHTQALELKQLGFNEPCWAWYNIPDEDIRYCYSEGRSPITNIQEEWDAKIDGKPVENVGLPTFSQVFKWFRDEHQLHNFIEYDSVEELYLIVVQYDYKKDTNTYEEAELECLNYLIQILKSKQ